MDWLLAGVFGGAASTAQNVWGYNRNLYNFDTHMRQASVTQRQWGRKEWLWLHREDITNLTGMTTAKMGIYTVFCVLQLGSLFSFLGEGKLFYEYEGDAPISPVWITLPYSITWTASFAFLMLATWFALHASVLASSGSASLLIQSNQLRSFPTGLEVDQVRRRYQDFEQVHAERMLRVPFVDRVLEEESEPEAKSEGGDASDSSDESGRSPGRSSSGSCSRARRDVEGERDAAKPPTSKRESKGISLGFETGLRIREPSKVLFGDVQHFHYKPDAMEHNFLNEIAEEASRREYFTAGLQQQDDMPSQVDLALAGQKLAPAAAVTAEISNEQPLTWSRRTASIGEAAIDMKHAWLEQEQPQQPSVYSAPTQLGAQDRRERSLRMHSGDGELGGASLVSGQVGGSGVGRASQRFMRKSVIESDAAGLQKFAELRRASVEKVDPFANRERESRRHTLHTTGVLVGDSAACSSTSKDPLGTADECDHRERTGLRSRKSKTVSARRLSGQGQCAQDDSRGAQHRRAVRSTSSQKNDTDQHTSNFSPSHEREAADRHGDAVAEDDVSAPELAAERRFLVRASHLDQYRCLQRHWQSYDAYARVSMLAGTLFFLTCGSSYCSIYYFKTSPCISFVSVFVLAFCKLTVAKLDFSASRGWHLLFDFWIHAESLCHCVAVYLERTAIAQESAQFRFVMRQITAGIQLITIAGWTALLVYLAQPPSGEEAGEPTHGVPELAANYGSGEGARGSSSSGVVPLPITSIAGGGQDQQQNTENSGNRKSNIARNGEAFFTGGIGNDCVEADANYDDEDGGVDNDPKGDENQLQTRRRGESFLAKARDSFTVLASGSMLVQKLPSSNSSDSHNAPANSSKKSSVKKEEHPLLFDRVKRRAYLPTRFRSIAFMDALAWRRADLATGVSAPTHDGNARLRRRRTANDGADEDAADRDKYDEYSFREDKEQVGGRETLTPQKESRWGVATHRKKSKRAAGAQKRSKTVNILSRVSGAVGGAVRRMLSSSVKKKNRPREHDSGPGVADVATVPRIPEVVGADAEDAVDTLINLSHTQDEGQFRATDRTKSLLAAQLLPNEAPIFRGRESMHSDASSDFGFRGCLPEARGGGSTAGLASRMFKDLRRTTKEAFGYNSASDEENDRAGATPTLETRDAGRRNATTAVRALGRSTSLPRESNSKAAARETAQPFARASRKKAKPWPRFRASQIGRVIQQDPAAASKGDASLLRANQGLAPVFHEPAFLDGVVAPYSDPEDADSLLQFACVMYTSYLFLSEQLNYWLALFSKYDPEHASLPHWEHRAGTVARTLERILHGEPEENYNGRNWNRSSFLHTLPFEVPEKRYVQLSGFDQMSGLFFTLYQGVDGECYYREPPRDEYVTENDVLEQLELLEAQVCAASTSGAVDEEAIGADSEKCVSVAERKLRCLERMAGRLRRSNRTLFVGDDAEDDDGAGLLPPLPLRGPFGSRDSMPRGRGPFCSRDSMPTPYGRRETQGDGLVEAFPLDEDEEFIVDSLHHTSSYPVIGGRRLTLLPFKESRATMISRSPALDDLSEGAERNYASDDEQLPGGDEKGGGGAGECFPVEQPIEVLSDGLTASPPHTVRSWSPADGGDQQDADSASCSGSSRGDGSGSGRTKSAKLSRSGCTSGLASCFSTPAKSGPGCSPSRTRKRDVSSRDHRGVCFPQPRQSSKPSRDTPLKQEDRSQHLRRVQCSAPNFSKEIDIVCNGSGAKYDDQAAWEAAALPLRVFNGLSFLLILSFLVLAVHSFVRAHLCDFDHKLLSVRESGAPGFVVEEYWHDREVGNEGNPAAEQRAKPEDGDADDESRTVGERHVTKLIQQMAVSGRQTKYFTHPPVTPRPLSPRFRRSASSLSFMARGLSLSGDRFRMAMRAMSSPNLPVPEGGGGGPPTSRLMLPPLERPQHADAQSENDYIAHVAEGLRSGVFKHVACRAECELVVLATQWSVHFPETPGRSCEFNGREIASVMLEANSCDVLVLFANGHVVRCPSADDKVPLQRAGGGLRDEDAYAEALLQHPFENSDLLMSVRLKDGAQDSTLVWLPQREMGNNPQGPAAAREPIDALREGMIKRRPPPPLGEGGNLRRSPFHVDDELTHTAAPPMRLPLQRRVYYTPFARFMSAPLKYHDRNLPLAAVRFGIFARDQFLLHDAASRTYLFRSTPVAEEGGGWVHSLFSGLSAAVGGAPSDDVQETEREGSSAVNSDSALSKKRKEIKLEKVVTNPDWRSACSLSENRFLLLRIGALEILTHEGYAQEQAEKADAEEGEIDD